MKELHEVYFLAGVDFFFKGGGELVRGIYLIILPCELKKKWIFQGVRTPPPTPPTPSLDPRICKPKKFRLLYQGFHLHIYEYRTLQKNTCTWVYIRVQWSKRLLPVWTSKKAFYFLYLNISILSFTIPVEWAKERKLSWFCGWVC